MFQKTNVSIVKWFLLVFVVAVLTGCGSSAPAAAPAEAQAADGEAPAEEFVVGALHVGSISDAGYNQAHHDGLVEMTERLPNVKLSSAPTSRKRPTWRSRTASRSAPISSPTTAACRFAATT